MKFNRFSNIVFFMLLASLITVSAWAGLSMVNTHSDKVISAVHSTSQISKAMPIESRTRAPEPSTLLLFGTGILGMIISAIRRTYHITKRILDIISSVLGLIILSPLLLATVVLIKLTSRGPIFYTQTRVGKDGVLFEIYKFRTMKVDAEKESGPVWAAKNDNRLIPCGKFLRKAHIDELPQLINILKGEMSLIGPRPERPVFVEKFKKAIPDYYKRLYIKPGLTGIAQVWYKYDESMEDVRKKVKYDLLYIKKACLWTDMRIILRTVRVVFTGEGAQ
ncbi:MAG: exopolysaccharide biosynthesis polyprenyl glycosylphosphotransferase [Candidatus Omnitrophica bacterium]|nr:exopolysaccharide biosynthesis polyprenyl glycosylphosphotransferase [Candidatus Omnitrophota bacterium]